MAKLLTVKENHFINVRNDCQADNYIVCLLDDRYCYCHKILNNKGKQTDIIVASLSACYA